MFNSFVFEKRLDEFKKLKTERKKEANIKRKHSLEREHLVKSYNNRVQKFMVDMFERPINVPEYKEREHEFRDVKNSGLIGKPRFVTYGWVTERQRIQENIEKNLEVTFHEAVDDRKSYNILNRPTK